MVVNIFTDSKYCLGCVAQLKAAIQNKQKGEAFLHLPSV